MKKRDVGELFLGLACLIIGIVILFHPQIVMNTLVMIIGITILVYGALLLIQHFVCQGTGDMIGIVSPVIYILCGVLLIVFSNTIVGTILPFIIGLWMVIMGALGVSTSYQLKSAGFPKWWFPLINAGISLLLGIIILFYRDIVPATFGILVGIYLVIFGIFKIFETTAFMSIRKDL